MKLIMLIVLFSMNTFAKKDNHRQLGPHAHGAGTLGIAFEGNKAKMDFKIPSDGIIGFEYTPKTEKDKATKKAQLEKFESKISSMVEFDRTLNCNFKKESLDIVKDLEESKETHSEHSDAFAVFNIDCDKSPAGTKIIFNFQSAFPKINKLEIQVLVGDIQKSVEAVKDGTTIELK